MISTNYFESLKKAHTFLLELAKKQIAKDALPYEQLPFEQRIASDFASAYSNPKDGLMHAHRALELISDNYEQIKDEFAIDIYDIAFAATLAQLTAEQTPDWLPYSKILQPLIRWAKADFSCLEQEEDEQERQTQQTWMSYARSTALSCLDTLLRNVFSSRNYHEADNFMQHLEQLGFWQIINQAAHCPEDIKTAFSILCTLYQNRPEHLKTIVSLDTAFVGFMPKDPTYQQLNCLIAYYGHFSQSSHSDEIKQTARANLSEIRYSPLRLSLHREASASELSGSFSSSSLGFLSPTSPGKGEGAESAYQAPRAFNQ